MLIEIFIPLLIIAGASLFCGVKYKKTLLCMISSVLFIILSLSPTIELVSEKVVLVFREGLINLVTWIGFGIATAFSSLGFISAIRGRK